MRTVEAGKGLHTVLAAVLTFICATAVTVATGAEHNPITSDQVDASLKRGARAQLHYLEGYQQSGNVGYTILGVMAALNAGVPADDPTVANAINFLLHDSNLTPNQYAGTYQAGLMNMLLVMLKDPQTYRRLAERMAAALQRYQNKDGGWGDYSRTQFALLGLKAAQDMGVVVPPQVFQLARRNVEFGQNEGGSWGYTPKSGNGYGSMTAAGITSLSIIYEQDYKDNPLCGAAHNTDRLQQALHWLGRNFTVETNPQNGGYHYYYLYALERIGVLTGQKYIGGHDWYRDGASYLVGHQNPSGAWNGDGLMATEFSLLFLGKGRDPVAIQKLCYGADWNPDPYDAKNLVEQAGKELKTPMATQVIDTNATANALSAAPVLYLQGRKAFEFTPALRESIKTFLEQGGFIFASACCGGKEFDHSFRAEMHQMYPDAAFERLPDDHDIFKNVHKIASPNAFMMEGLNTGCRTSVFYAPHDICCAWGKCKGCLDKLCLSGTDAPNLGVNMIAYVLNFRSLRDKLDDINVVANKAGISTPRGALIIGQLYHTGDWDPDPGSIPNLARTLKEQTGMKAEVAKRKVVLGTDDPGEYPILYLTGHQAFQFAPSQVDILRAYLDKGGFLLSDPCCGKFEFDRSFRHLCELLYPEKALKELPMDHPVFLEPYAIRNVQYKPAVTRLFPQTANKAQFEGISGADGRLQILYSRFNFGCELQGHGCPGCLGLATQDAYKFAVNAVLYALSH